MSCMVSVTNKMAAVPEQHWYKDNMFVIAVLITMSLISAKAMPSRTSFVANPSNGSTDSLTGASAVPAVTTDSISAPLPSPNAEPASLPDGWDGLCTRSQEFVSWNFTTLSTNDVRNMVQISCYLQNNQLLFFSELRQWLNVNNFTTKFALKVECDVNTVGTFSAPWPMKVRNLVYLEITGCQVTDYYSEYFDESVTLIPDQLRVYQLRNARIQVDVLQVFAIAKKADKTSRDVECGSLLIEKWDFVNIEYDINFVDYLAALEQTNVTSDAGVSDVDNGDYSDDSEDISEQLMSNFIKLKHQCPYDHLRDMDESYFRSMSGKHLYSLQTKAFYPELRIYNLSHVGFDIVPIELRRWRFTMKKLNYLDLSHNDIHEFEFYDDGVEEYGIGIIDLRYNSIRQLRDTDLRAIMRLKTATIDIRNNLFNCSCGMLHDFREYLKIPNLGRYEYLRDLECGWPESLRGKKVSELSEVQVQCTEGLFALTGVLACVVLLLVILVVVLWKYRREVVILVYTRLHIVLPCQTVEKAESKEYDAFISYSSRDDEWVLKSLVQRLENTENGLTGFKLCVHHRDFEIGAAIADNVVRSVESSRHTIMVLSRNYVQSEWCIYEFRTAMHQSLIERRKHLILILLEDVPKSELDSDLRKCLETFTYIHVGETLFWDKLQYTLTVRKKRKSVCKPPQSLSIESSEKKNLKHSSNNNIV